MQHNKIFLAILFTTLLSFGGCGKKQNNDQNREDNGKNLAVSFSFDSTNGSYTKDNASGSSYRIDYVFAEENAPDLFKKPNDPLLKQGVHGKSLYMDGFSTKIKINDYEAPTNKLTFSTWVAPRGFENLNRYGNEYSCKGHPRMTTLFNW